MFGGVSAPPDHFREDEVEEKVWGSGGPRMSTSAGPERVWGCAGDPEALVAREARPKPGLP